jgi:hypothetical protein
MNLSRGLVFRIGVLLVSPCACNENVPLGDKGNSGNFDQQVGGSHEKVGAAVLESISEVQRGRKSASVESLFPLLAAC